MKYTTNDLSKILNVSTNTIRRYEEKGFLNATRNEVNGYREFDSIDIEKLMYTNKYRKIGFSQEDISAIFEEDIRSRKMRFSEKMAELDEEMKRMYSLRHMMKDDLQLLNIIDEFSDEIKPYRSCSMHIVLYQVKGNVNLGKEQSAAIHNFLETCPEYEHIYYFDKNDFANELLVYSEGVVANEIITKKYEVSTEPPVEYYPAKQCIMRVVRVPLDLTEQKMMTEQEISYILFGQFNEYMISNNMELEGDVIGLKLGISKEEGNTWQYLLMHVPVNPIS